MSEVVNNMVDCRVTLDGADLTDKIRPRLMSLRITEKRGDEADQLDIVLDDSSGILAMPKLGAVLRVEIGWKKGSGIRVGLVDKGRYKVDSVEHGGPPDTITIRARSADFSSTIRNRREQSWRDKTLGEIVHEVAGRNKLTPRVDAKLSAITLKLVTQSRESDIAFLKRLGREHDAVATIKDKTLIFAPIGKGVTASGKAIPAATIRRREGDRHSYTIEKRDDYSGVTASWHDTRGATRRKVTVGTDDNAKSLRRVYPSEAEARRAAKAEQGRIQRAPAKFTCGLALGQPDLYPERKVKAEGFKAEIDATAWLIVEVTHELGERGLTTALQLETAPYT